MHILKPKPYVTTDSDDEDTPSDDEETFQHDLQKRGFCLTSSKDTSSKDTSSKDNSSKDTSSKRVTATYIANKT